MQVNKLLLPNPASLQRQAANAHEYSWQILLRLPFLHEEYPMLYFL